jgi:hypothetical protein
MEKITSAWNSHNECRGSCYAIKAIIKGLLQVEVAVAVTQKPEVVLKQNHMLSSSRS